MSLPVDVAPDVVERHEVHGDLDLVRTCRPLRSGDGDPTWRISPHAVARARRTPDGPATVEIARDGPDHLMVRAWGPGAALAAGDAPALIGLHDSLDGFHPELHPVVRRCARGRAGARWGAARHLWDVAVPTVLGQRVTAGEALSSWRRLVQRDGTPAPGPLGLRLAPSPARIAALGDADWHVLGVERRRADAARMLARHHEAVQRAADAGTDELLRVLGLLPGIGPWTATGLAIVGLGDPDVVLLGDLHVPHGVCHALAGEERGDDARMLELLAPWAGHRGRVARLLAAAGPAPRRGPRYRPLPIARM